MKSLILYKKSYTFPKYLDSFSKFFKLNLKKNKKAGRNNQGRICVWHKGGGHKKKYRPLDLNNLNKSYRLLSIEYDPCRSAFIGLYLNIESKKLFFDLVNEGQKIGEIYGISESLDDISVGTKMFLRDIPLGTLISSLEIKQGKGSQYLRSAGAYGKVQKKDGNFAFIKMPSKRIIKITLDCMATIGIISNIAHKNKVLAKAGRSRWLNSRPHVRGVAMNPVDHPHGGGEGKTSGGRHPVTPWGKLTKGKKTRRKKVFSNLQF